MDEKFTGHYWRVHKPGDMYYTAWIFDDVNNKPLLALYNLKWPDIENLMPIVLGNGLIISIIAGSGD